MPRLLFILLSCCVVYSASSQNVIKVTVYSNDSAHVIKAVDSAATQPQGLVGFRNMFKWNFSMLGRGALIFNYERVINKHFTIEVGFGPTYSDFIFAQYYDIGVFRKGGASTTSTNYNTGTTTTTGLVATPLENATKFVGFSAELNPRYYFDKEEFEGLYISPFLAYSKYNYGVTIEEQTNQNGIYGITPRNFTDLYYTFFDLGFRMGYQFSPSEYYSHVRRYNNDRFCYDIYWGAAYRGVNFNTLMKTETTDPSGTTVTYSEFLQTFSLFRIMVGVKMGFTF